MYGHGGMNAGGARSMPSSFSSWDSQKSQRGNDPLATWGVMDDSGEDNSSRPGMQKAYDNLKGFFGEARPGRADLFKDMSEAEVENADYPQAFQMLYGSMQEGVMERNGHIEKLMIEKTVKSDVFWIQKLAPWRYSNSQYITWNATIFNQTSLDRLPEESVPRLMSQRQTGGATSLMRYGIAMLLEATFAETAIGRRTYLMNLEQIRVATTDTAAYGVLITLMEHQPYEDPMERHQMGSSRTDLGSIDERLLAEIDGFGIMQKQEDGASLVRARMKARLKLRGVEPNVTLWPSGASAYVDMSVSDAMHNEESMSFSSGGDEGLHDPLFRHRTIGAFATLDDRCMRSRPVADYRTSCMDTVLYDGLADKYFYAEYRVNHRYAGVWNYNAPGAPLTEKIGGATMRDLSCYTYGQIYRKCARGAFLRAVEKTYLIGKDDHDKRSEFLATMLLHKADDQRVKLDGLPFPREEDFSEKVLNEPRHFSRDQWAQRPLTVADHVRADEVKNASSTRAINERALYEARMRDTKRKLGLDEDFEPRGTKETFDATHDADDTTMTIPARFVTLPDGSGVARIPESTAVVRPVRQRFAVGRPAQEVTAVYSGEGVGSYVTEILELTKGLKQDADVIDVLNTQLKKAVELIRDSPDATDAQKITLLAEYKRVVDGVFYKLQWEKRDGAVNNAREAFAKDTTKEAAYVAQLKIAAEQPPEDLSPAKVAAHVAAGFVPFASRMQLRMAVDSLLEERTAIEDRVSAAGSNLYQSIPVEVANASAWWKPDGRAEDGQVRLAVSTSDSLPIPHDAFAATLAANHNVVFSLSDAEAATLATKFLPSLDGGGAKRGRVDALAWSIALSVLAVKPATASNTAKTLVDGLKAVADPKSPEQVMLARLKRVANAAKTSPRGVLMSQTHLNSLIAALSHQLSKALEVSATAPAPAELKWPAETEPIPARGYESPVQLNIKALLASRTSKAPVSTPLTTPANAEQQQAWSKAFIANCYNRASVHDGRLYAWCVDNDVPVPFCLRANRPNKCFNMGSAMMLKAGRAGAAITYYQMPHMMMAGNAAQKMIYGHFTMYFKTVVVNNAMITIDRDIYCTRAVGGSGRASWDPNNPVHTTAYKNNQLSTASIFWTFAPQDSADCHWWQSLTGALPSSMPGDENVAARIAWPGASGFAAHWNYNTGGSDHSLSSPFKWRTDRNDRKHNVILIQDFQMKYDPTENRYSDVVINAGHWGPNSCYPGAAAVLRAGAKTFMTPNYMPTKQVDFKQIRG